MVEFKVNKAKERIRELRINANLSQEELGLRLCKSPGMSRAGYSAAESISPKNVFFTIEQILNLEKEFNVPCQLFLTGNLEVVEAYFKEKGISIDLDERVVELKDLIKNLKAELKAVKEKIAFYESELEKKNKTIERQGKTIDKYNEFELNTSSIKKVKR